MTCQACHRLVKGLFSDGLCSRCHPKAATSLPSPKTKRVAAWTGAGQGVSQPIRNHKSPVTMQCKEGQ